MGKNSSCPIDDIVINDDNYVGKYASAFEDAGEVFDKVISDYCQILIDLVEENGLCGQTADNLLSFAQLAKSILENSAGEVLSEQKNTLSSYIDDVDEIDEEIY